MKPDRLTGADGASAAARAVAGRGATRIPDAGARSLARASNRRNAATIAISAN